MALATVAAERKATLSNNAQCCLKLEMASLLTLSLNVASSINTPA